jgi:hypothetical protein
VPPKPQLDQSVLQEGHVETLSDALQEAVDDPIQGFDLQEDRGLMYRRTHPLGGLPASYISIARRTQFD